MQKFKLIMKTMAIVLSIFVASISFATILAYTTVVLGLLAVLMTAGIMIAIPLIFIVYNWLKVNEQI